MKKISLNQKVKTPAHGYALRNNKVILAVILSFSFITMAETTEHTIRLGEPWRSTCKNVIIPNTKDFLNIEMVNPYYIAVWSVKINDKLTRQVHRNLCEQYETDVQVKLYKGPEYITASPRAWDRIGASSPLMLPNYIKLSMGKEGLICVIKYKTCIRFRWELELRNGTTIFMEPEYEFSDHLEKLSGCQQTISMGNFTFSRSIVAYGLVDSSYMNFTLVN